MAPARSCKSEEAGVIVVGVLPTVSVKVVEVLMPRVVGSVTGTDPALLKAVE
jgi:hypothetical protein